jgi:iron complex outermembrane receptor protein
MVFSGWSQKTVTGSVVDDGGVPLPGATVLEVNTANGVTTDFDGNFSIQVADGATLEISFVGYDNQTITVGSQDNYEIVLSAGNELEEVVVTSLGLKREAKALGYAVHTVIVMG